MVTVAVITARANSKGVPKKNLREVAGRSLVRRAVECALGAGIERVIVTTDGDEIAEEALRYGAEVIRRSEALSSDTARSIDAVVDVLQQIGAMAGEVILLQPTSPLRSTEDLRGALALYRVERAASVVAVTECDHHPFKCLLKTDSGHSPVMTMADFEAPRQQLPKAYRINGAIYVNDIATLLRQKTFFSQPIHYFEMPASRSIDIDHAEDLTIANLICKECSND